MTTRRKHADVAPPPAKYADVWFAKNFVGVGFVKGRVTKSFPMGHPTKLEDLYLVDFVDGDSEKLTAEEVNDLISTGKCDPPSKDDLAKEEEIRSSRHASSHAHASPRKPSRERQSAATDTDTANASDNDESASENPKKKSKGGRTVKTTSRRRSAGSRATKAKSKSSSSSSSSSSNKGNSENLAERVNADSWYGPSYKVEKVIGRKYEAVLKYNVRWQGSWPPEEKETWEDANHMHPKIVKQYEKAHGVEPPPTFVEGDVAREIRRLQEEKLLLLKNIKLLLVYLEPPTWKDHSRPVNELDSEGLLRFPVKDFLHEYANALNQLVGDGDADDEDDDDEDEEDDDSALPQTGQVASINESASVNDEQSTSE